MTEIEFFNILMDKLNTLPESQLYDVINYYKEYFSNDLIRKRPLEEIIKDLDDPKFIMQILLNKNKTTQSNIDLINTNQSNKVNNVNSEDISCKKDMVQINHNKSLNINILLKLGIMILSIITLFPILTAIIAITINLCTLCIKIIITCLNLALDSQYDFKICDIIPEFIFNFPEPVLFFFSIGTMLLSIFLILSIWYIFKLICITIINLFTKLNENMGDL